MPIVSKIILLALLLANTQLSFAISQSHLIPEEGMYGARMFNPYWEAVGNRLIQNDKFRICQAVVLPSFSPEYAIYIKYDKDNPANIPIVVSLKFEKQLWAEMNKLLDSRTEKVRLHITEPDAQRYALSKIQSTVVRSAAPIETDLATLLENVWVNMLAQVRYPEKSSIGLDGVKYHFATFLYRKGYRSGQACSPPKGTVVYDLVNIVELLGKYPSVKEKDRKQISQNLQTMAGNLLDRMKNNK